MLIVLSCLPPIRSLTEAPDYVITPPEHSLRIYTTFSNFKQEYLLAYKPCDLSLVLLVTMLPYSQETEKPRRSVYSFTFCFRQQQL